MNIDGNTDAGPPGNAVAIRALSPGDIELVVELSVRAWRTYEAAGFTPWPHVTYVKLLD